VRTLAELALTFVFNASWQILLIAATAALCHWLLRGAAARYQHAIWVVALVLSVVLPGLSTAPRFFKTTISAEQQRPEISSPTVYTRVSSVEGEEIESAEVRTPAAPSIVEPTAGKTGSAIGLNPRLAATAFLLYSLLVLYACLRFFRAWRRTRKIVSTAFQCDLPESIQQIILECSRAISTRRVRILFSTSVQVPITVGVLKPLIILPQPLLHEVDKEMLTSAIAHEMVHVARHDYLANLIYEFAFLPLWFHPATSLIRRRIRQTRELCCDERVVSKLMGPEIYARSLVRLIGASPLTARLAADNTIGITESDNLEVRIMSLLKTRKLGRRPKAVLLLAACLSLAAPCLAASSFALGFEINDQEPLIQDRTRQQQQELKKQNQIRAELKQQIHELEQKRLASPSQRAEIETRLREVKRVLEQHEKLAQQFQQQNPEARVEADARLSEVRRNLIEHARLLEEYQQKAAKSSRVPEAQTTLAELLAKYPDAKITRQGQVLDDQKHLEELQAKLASVQNTRKPRVIRRVEPVYPADARDKNIKGSVVLTMVVDRDGNPQDIKIWEALYPSMDQAAVEAARQMRFEPALKDGQPVPETLLIEFYFSLESKHVQVMGYGEGKGAGQGVGSQGMGSGGDVREVRRRKDQEVAGQDERARRQAELAQGAVISMDRAVQIATSKFSGKVLACSLGRDKDGPVFYHLVIINTESGQTTTKYVWISAIDGTIIKTEDEKKAAVSGGVLNGKALSLPNPEYPEIARAAQASGSVTVQITIDEQGNIISARAVSGHPLLQGAAVNAARNAKFTPTYLQGQPVIVTGQLVYNFVAQ